VYNFIFNLLNRRYMKSINNTLFGSLMVMFFLFTSCDYLDVVPPATATIDDALENREDAIRFLFGSYAGITHGYPFADFDNSVDEFINPVKWDDPDLYTACDRLSSASTHCYVWSRCYKYLGECHLFMQQLDKSNPTGVSQEDRTRWKAEVKFLEAYYHFRLLETYGPIPIVNKYYSLNTSKADFPGRSPYDVCVDSICNWLDEAAVILPATLPTEEIGRATSTICKALKSRVLLYAASPLWNSNESPYKNFKNKDGQNLVAQGYSKDKWNKALAASLEALTYAESKGDCQLFNVETSANIRKNEGVPLPEIPGADDNFRERVVMLRYMMTAKRKNGNKENIWTSMVDDSWGWGGDVLAALPNNILKNSYNGTLASGCASKCPILYTMEHFYTQEGKLPEKDSKFPGKSQWLESAGLSDPNIIKLNVNREPRYYAWLSFDGDEYSSILSQGNPLIINDRDANLQGYNPNGGHSFDGMTGFWTKKMLQPDLKMLPTSTTWTWNNDNLNFPLIRLAEMYLNVAECYSALGDEANALKYLNPIRKRAGIPELTIADVTTSGMSITEWVRNERFVELWGELHRYYDLRRWLTAPDRLKVGSREGLNYMQKKNPTFEELNQRVTIDVPYSWSNRMYLIPIAADEIYSNPQLVQAPGY
jgi:hypothetical protein